MNIDAGCSVHNGLRLDGEWEHRPICQGVSRRGPTESQSMSEADLDGDGLNAQTFEVCFPVPTVPSDYSPRQQFQYSLVTGLSTSIVPSTRPHILCYFSNMFAARTCDFVSWNDHAIVLNILGPPFPLSPVQLHTRPPTLGIFHSVNPNQLLSPTHLRLISSVLTRTYEAIAACCAVNVFRRDIKPKNFLVTDGWITSPDGRKA